MKDWFSDYFDKDYFKVYSTFLTPEVSRRDSEFIVKALGLRKGMKVLDLCCGQGRISINLAKAGYQMMGVDLSAPLLNIARKEAVKRKVKIRFVKKDMREISFKGNFDAVVCMLTSFGYFNDKENKNVIKKISLSLKRGGKFLLDVGNPEWIANNLKPCAERKIGEMIVEEKRYLSSDNKRVKNIVKYTYPKTGKTKSFITDFRQYTEVELRKIFGRCGLSVIKVFGDYDVDCSLTSDSKRLLILAEKNN